ncbi:MAG: DUF3892 domain-containing protein [Syntrophomonadales bacterium]|jgi:hypothetical protein
MSLEQNTNAAQRKVTGIQLNDGRVLSIEEAITETNRNHVQGLFAGVDRHGQRYLKVRINDEAEENQDSVSLI